jgi:hypothetical protein
MPLLPEIWENDWLRFDGKGRSGLEPYRATGAGATMSVNSDTSS